MRAVDEDRARGRSERFVDVAGVERHVRAILAVEDQRELLAVANAEDNERGQPVRVGVDRS